MNKDQKTKKISLPERRFASLILSISLLILTSFALSEKQTIVTEVESTVSVIQGAAEPVSKTNKGQTANIGLIKTDAGVWVINTGISHRHATQIINAARNHHDSKIIGTVILQAEREIALGADTFQQQRIPVYAHPKTRDLMHAGCDLCIDALREILGEDEMSETKTATKIKDTRELEISDRGDFYVIEPKKSVLPGAIMVYHPKTKTLLSGNLIFENLIPSIKNADLSAWRTTLEDLKTLDISTIIPTMGEVTSVLAIEASLNYLRDLENRTSKLYRDNTDLLSATKLGHIEHYAKWKMYNDRHFNNVMYQYLHLESKDLN